MSFIYNEPYQKKIDFQETSPVGVVDWGTKNSYTIKRVLVKQLDHDRVNIFVTLLTITNF